MPLSQPRYLSLRHSLSVLFFITLLSPLARGAAPAPYPPYETKNFIAPPSNLEEGALRVVQDYIEEQFKKTYPTPAEDFFPPAEWWFGITDHFASLIPNREWKVVTSPGRMPLPQVLVWGGLFCGLDQQYRVNLLATDQASYMTMYRFATVWEVVMQNFPAEAFALLAKDAARAQPTTIDILRLEVTLGYWPGDKLQGAPHLSDWEALHDSPNPCLRLIAMEKFDSLPRTQREILTLYRECLFGACSYLEARALHRILCQEDFRPEVAALLEEYANSPPLSNDGTRPDLRMEFRSFDLQENARDLIAKIRATKPTPQTGDPFAQPHHPSRPLLPFASQSHRTFSSAVGALFRQHRTASFFIAALFMGGIAASLIRRRSRQTPS